MSYGQDTAYDAKLVSGPLEQFARLAPQGYCGLAEARDFARDYDATIELYSAQTGARFLVTPKGYS